MSYGASLSFGYTYSVEGFQSNGAPRARNAPEGGRTAGLEVRQCEGEQRVAVRRAEHHGQEAFGPAAPSARRHDVLLAVDAVRRRARVVAAAALELPQVLAALRVQRVELTGRLAAEHEPAARRQQRRAHRQVALPAPALRAGARVERADRAGDVLRVDRHAGAPVRDALDELAT